PTLGMQEPRFHELVDRLAGLERRVELQQWLRRQHARLEPLLDRFRYMVISDVDEALDVGEVALDKLVPEPEYIHAAFLPGQKCHSTLHYLALAMLRVTAPARF